MTNRFEFGACPARRVPRTTPDPRRRGSWNTPSACGSVSLAAPPTNLAHVREPEAGRLLSPSFAVQCRRRNSPRCERAQVTRAGGRMDITLTVSEELATQLRSIEKDLSQILELGIRAWHARREVGFAGMADVLET